MIYVVVEDLIPEMSEGEHSNVGTVLFATGFTLMIARTLHWADIGNDEEAASAFYLDNMIRAKRHMQTLVVGVALTQ